MLFCSSEAEVEEGFEGDECAFDPTQEDDNVSDDEALKSNTSQSDINEYEDEAPNANITDVAAEMSVEDILFATLEYPKQPKVGSFFFVTNEEISFLKNHMPWDDVMWRVSQENGELFHVTFIVFTDSITNKPSHVFVVLASGLRSFMLRGQLHRRTLKMRIDHGPSWMHSECQRHESYEKYLRWLRDSHIKDSNFGNVSLPDELEARATNFRLWINERAQKYRKRTKVDFQPFYDKHELWLRETPTYV